jgi:hypothetical protein
MLVSETYLNEYKDILTKITRDVNEYLLNNNLVTDPKLLIKPSFFLQFLSNKKLFYREIIIYQHNKKRVLQEPILELKYIQKYILHKILYSSIQDYKFDQCVTGFMKKKSILTNAKQHLNKKALIKMDIKDFFSSISRTMIYNIFKRYNKFSYEYAYILSHLVTYTDSLPQGAPTSPFLANVCANGIDFRINKLISTINTKQRMEISYTRYADDITISFDKKFNYDYMIGVVTEIIIGEGFYPNMRKNKIIKKNNCQKVTGIVVNNKVASIEKSEREKIKFTLQIWKKYGIESAISIWNKHKFGRLILDIDKDKCTQKFQEVLCGKITYFKMVNSEQSKNLEDEFGQLSRMIPAFDTQ